MNELLAYIRYKRVERLLLAHHDQVAYKREWGFARTPSEMHKLAVGIEKSARKLGRLIVRLPDDQIVTLENQIGIPAEVEREGDFLVRQGKVDRGES